MTPEFGYDEVNNIVRIRFIGELNVEKYASLKNFINSLPRRKG